jgi:hypothetical protein
MGHTDLYHKNVVRARFPARPTTMEPSRRSSPRRRRNLARLNPAQILHATSTTPRGGARAPRWQQPLPSSRRAQPPPAESLHAFAESSSVVWPGGTVAVAGRRPATADTPSRADALAGPRGGSTRAQALRAQLEKELETIARDASLHDDEVHRSTTTLQAYGRCWDQVTLDFRLYQPLFMSIKAEYERFIEHYRGKVAQMQPELRAVEQLEAERAAALQRALEDRDTRARELRAELAESEAARARAEEGSVEAAGELERLTADIQVARADVTNLHATNVALVQTIELYETELTTQGELEAQERDNMHVYQTELDGLLQQFHHVTDKHKV